MVLFMMASGSKENNGDWAKCFTLTVTIIMATGKKIYKIDMGLLFMQMRAMRTKDNLRMVYQMVQEIYFIQMELNILEMSIRNKNMG